MMGDLALVYTGGQDSLLYLQPTAPRKVEWAQGAHSASGSNPMAQD